MLKIRKLFYLLFMAELILPIGAIQLAITSGYINLSGWCLAFILFTGIPIVEHIIGVDSTHTINDLKESQEKYSYYSILTLLCVPSVIVLSLYSAHFFSDTPGLNWIGRIGWMITIGICIAALALCAAHELIHRKALLERLVGGFLLAFVCHSDFMVTHIRGHHAKVATPSDRSSARFGQSLYHFLLQSYRYSTANAWVLENEKLNRRGYSALSWHNELIWWNALSIVLCPWSNVLFLFRSAWPRLLCRPGFRSDNRPPHNKLFSALWIEAL